MNSRSQPVSNHVDAFFGHSPAEHVSVDDVKRAVEKLNVDGKPVTLRSLHEVVGRGSRSTIHKHLKVLRNSASAIDRPSPHVLSPRVAEALAIEVQLAVSERTKHLVVELEDASTSLDLVAQENDLMRAAALESAALLASTRDSLAHRTGTADALQTQLDEHRITLQASKQELDMAKQELSLMRERLTTCHERQLAANEERKADQQVVESLRRQVITVKEERDASRQESSQLQGRLETAVKADFLLEQVGKRADELQALLSESTKELAAVKAERAGLRERLAETQRVLGRSESTVEMLVAKLLKEQKPPNEQ